MLIGLSLNSDRQPDNAGDIGHGTLGHLYLSFMWHYVVPFSSELIGGEFINERDLGPGVDKHWVLVTADVRSRRILQAEVGVLVSPATPPARLAFPGG